MVYLKRLYHHLRFPVANVPQPELIAFITHLCLLTMPIAGTYQHQRSHCDLACVGSLQFETTSCPDAAQSARASRVCLALLSAFPYEKWKVNQYRHTVSFVGLIRFYCSFSIGTLTCLSVSALNHIVHPR